MRPILTVSLLFFFIAAKAQTNPATPNAGFESWTHNSSYGGYDDPVSWNDLNSSTGILGLFTCYKDSTPADVHSGMYSVQLITMSLLTELIPGTITTGTINTGSQVINGGIPYTLRPDSIIGWYKYTPASGDNGDIEFYVFGANHLDTIGQAFFKTPTTTVGTYTRFSLAVTYTSTATPDTALWIITSSNDQNTGHSGSQLIIDDLGLAFDSTTGIPPINNVENITVGPIPSTRFISINNGSNLKSLLFTLIDATGRKIEEAKIDEGTTNINIMGIAEGSYIYLIQNELRATVKSGKIVIQR